jgi:hypothetical protein
MVSQGVFDRAVHEQRSSVDTLTDPCPPPGPMLTDVVERLNVHVMGDGSTIGWRSHPMTNAPAASSAAPATRHPGTDRTRATRVGTNGRTARVMPQRSAVTRLRGARLTPAAPKDP